MLTKEQMKKNFDYFLRSPLLQAGYAMIHDHFYTENEAFILPPKNVFDNALPNLFLLPIDFAHLNHLHFSTSQNLTKEEIIYLKKLQNLGRNALTNGNRIATHYQYLPYDLGNDLHILKEKIQKQSFCKNKAQALYQIDTYLHYIEQYMKTMKNTNSTIYLQYLNAHYRDNVLYNGERYSFLADKTEQNSTVSKR